MHRNWGRIWRVVTLTMIHWRARVILALIALAKILDVLSH